MASSSFTAKEVECKSTMVPNWLELPRDITTNILQRLDTIDIVTSACHVCPLWWNICKDPLMWRTISIPIVSVLPFTHLDLTKICRYAVERSCGHLEVINIEDSITDDLLKFIAKNGRNLRCMRILGLHLSDKGFIDALRKLPQLEEVDISWCNLSEDSLEALGRSCPLLKVLKFDRAEEYYIAFDDDDDDDDDDDVDLIIAETMSRLSHLDIKGINLTDVGLLAILDGCPLLEYLDIGECSILDLSESLKKRCHEQIKNLKLPNLNSYDDYEYPAYLEDCFYEYLDPYDL